MKTKILTFFITVFVLAIVYGFYEYHRKPINIVDQKPELEIAAVNFVKQFEQNREQAIVEQKGKLIQVQGKITSLEEGYNSFIVVLDSGVKCELSPENKGTVIRNQKVTLKGVFAGYDEMFNEISLVRCHLLK